MLEESNTGKGGNNDSTQLSRSISTSSFHSEQKQVTTRFPNYYHYLSTRSFTAVHLESIKMKLSILSTTLALALVSAEPHFKRGSVSTWAPANATDCMFTYIQDPASQSQNANNI